MFINFKNNFFIFQQTSSKTLQLELVLPNQMLDDPHGFDSVSGVHRRSRPTSRTASILESKSPGTQITKISLILFTNYYVNVGFVNTRLVNYNRGLSHQPSIISNHHTNNDEHIPPPSTEEEKSKMTRFTKIYYQLIILIMSKYLILQAILCNHICN